MSKPAPAPLGGLSSARRDAEQLGQRVARRRIAALVAHAGRVRARLKHGVHPLLVRRDELQLAVNQRPGIEKSKCHDDESSHPWSTDEHRYAI